MAKDEEQNANFDDSKYSSSDEGIGGCVHYAKARYLESGAKHLLGYQPGSYDFQIMDARARCGGMLLDVAVAGCTNNAFFLEGLELAEFNLAATATRPKGVGTCISTLVGVVGHVTIEECALDVSPTMPSFSGWCLYWPVSVVLGHSNTGFSGDDNGD